MHTSNGVQLLPILPATSSLRKNGIRRAITVDLCRQGKNEEALSTLYAEDAVSVEAVAMPGGSQEAKGLAAIRAKGEWWFTNHEIHSASVTGPWPHGNRFIVGFQYDVTNKPSGRRMKMDEVGLYTIENGKIVREEFFYAVGA